MDGRGKLREGVKYYSGNNKELVDNGIYDKENKRYWNKISGKWVGKKVYDLNNWYWGFSIYENLNEDWIIKNLGILFEGDEVYGLTDKIGWFFEELCLREVKGSRSEVGDVEKGVYIDNETLIRILGSRYYKDLIKFFEKIGYLETVEGNSIPYNINKKIKTYRVKWSRIGNEIGWKFIENGKLIEGIIKKYSVTPVISKYELGSYKKLSLIVEDGDWKDIVLKRYNRKINEKESKLNWDIVSKGDKEKLKYSIPNKDDIEIDLKRIYRGINKILRHIQNGWVTEDMFKIDNFYGRLHSPISRLNKELREYLRIDGKKVVELDVKSCYVSCLIYLVEYLNNDRKESGNFLGIDGWFIKDELKKLEENWNRRKEIWSEFYRVDIEDYDLGEFDLSFQELLENWNIDGYNELRKFDNLLLSIELGKLNKWKKIIENKKDIDENDKFKLFQIGDKIKEIYKKKYLKDYGIVGRGMNKTHNLLKRVKKELDKKINYRNQDDIWVLEYNKLIKSSLFGKCIIGFCGGGLKDYLESNKIYYRDIEELRVYSLERDRLFNIGFMDFGDNSKFSNKDKVEIFETDKIKLGEGWDFNWDTLETFKKEIELDSFNILFKGGEYEVREKFLSKKQNLELIEEIKSKPKSWNKKEEELFGRTRMENFIKNYEDENGKEIIIKGNLNRIDDNRGIDKSSNYGSNQILKWRNLIYDRGEFGFDFYNWVGINVNWLTKSGNRQLYSRDYFKGLIMNILFSPNYISDLVDGDDKNTRDKIFGELNTLIKELKSISIRNDGNGKDIDMKMWNRDNYKFVSMILGYIEVDVMNNIKNLISGYNDFESKKFNYIQIHDGLLIDKNEYNKWKFILNRYLKENIGYMFMMN
tara:strand:+ start:53 stop:2662 length:2610 start_codon:yes stop_codon:yes gene_type:complete